MTLPEIEKLSSCTVEALSDCEMKKAIALFEIHDSFRITGRGIVFCGYLLEGEFSIGDQLVFNFKGQVLRRKINGVDWNLRTTRKRPLMGVMIESIEEQEICNLRNWNPDNVVGEIYSMDTRETEH